MQTITSPLQATLVEWLIAVGDTVAQNQVIAIVEAMKMEHEIRATVAGRMTECLAKVGDLVQQGEALAVLSASGVDTTPLSARADKRVVSAQFRPELAKVITRHASTLDLNRPTAVDKRHAQGHRTARENIAQLCDEDSFMEYGALAVAAQSQRRSAADLMANTPADGMVTGIGKVAGQSVVVMSYDATVLAGTQGMRNHQKTDRMLGIALAQKLPVVLFAEGGGGRPGDTDMPIVAGLHVTTFSSYAKLRGHVLVIGIANGRCFAGNAALLGCSDIIIATQSSNIGMGGPAMIEGGGLGIFKPEQIGPAQVQHANGVIDVLVADEVEAVAVAKEILYSLSSFQLASSFPRRRESTGVPTMDSRLRGNDEREGDDERGGNDGVCANTLRNAVPEDRVRAYDTRPIIDLLADEGSVIPLKTAYGCGIHTVLARMGGRSVGILANNPLHLGGAIDAPTASKAADFLNFCARFHLPVISLIDTPGFMVGPESEAQGHVKYASSMFIAGALYLEKAKAALRSMPFCSVVLRKGYGLGAMAMSAGGFHASTFTLAWPTAEFGAMGLEGAVRLGFKKELEACESEAERGALFQKLLAEHVARGSAINMAETLEIDAVIDPAKTREWLKSTLQN